MMSASVKLQKVDNFLGKEAWKATITQWPGDEPIIRYFPFTGGAWVDVTRQSMGVCDFRAGSVRGRAWRRIRTLYTPTV
jgi:hypothetical protein